jgi:hypothetical protein
MEIDRKRWTVRIEDFTGVEGLCDFVGGDQAILIKFLTVCVDIDSSHLEIAFLAKILVSCKLMFSIF